MILITDANILANFGVIVPCIWDKVFKNEPSRICERQPLKNVKEYGLLKQTTSLQIS